MIRVLYLGWIGFNNFGDELMWNLFKQMADEYLPADRYTIIPSVPGVDIQDSNGYDVVVLGGGSLLIPGYVDLLGEALDKGKRVLIWGSGYDCINRVKSGAGSVERPELQQESEAYRAKLAHAVQGAAYCGVRGPWTMQYLIGQGVSPGHLLESGDPGLLARADVLVSNPVELGKDRWIGVNWGTAYNRIYGADEAAVEDQLVEVCRSLIEDGYRIYYYVVWGPDVEPSKRLYERVGNPERTLLDPVVYGMSDYMKLVQGFDATINLKLHANVISAAAGTPFVCLGYRFKSFDFMHSLHLSEFLVPTNEERLGDRVLDAARLAVVSRERIAADMDERRKLTRMRLALPFTENMF